MIEASFDAGRSAAVSGAYQYDIGQRIRMHGLPAPDVFAEEDELLSGEAVAVQAQFSYEGDSQTEMRLAVYDEENDVWIAPVPDSMLIRSEDVHVYVYVSYGQTEETGRSKTMYEAVFRPIGRPAPGDTVTADQLNAWDVLVQEVNLTLTQTNTAQSNANAAAALAKEAADAAKEAAENAETAAQEARAEGEAVAQAWNEATASAVTLEPEEAASVELTEKEGVKHLTYGIPRGKDGAQGPQGPKGDTGPAGVTFKLVDTVLYITTDS